MKRKKHRRARFSYDFVNPIVEFISDLDDRFNSVEQVSSIDLEMWAENGLIPGAFFDQKNEYSEYVNQFGKKVIMLSDSESGDYVKLLVLEEGKN